MNFSESLKKNQDFQSVYRNGKSYANRLLVMYVLENIFNSGLDIVVVARANAASASFREIESALLHLGKLHKIMS